MRDLPSTLGYVSMAFAYLVTSEATNNDRVNEATTILFHLMKDHCKSDKDLKKVIEVSLANLPPRKVSVN